MQESPSSSPFLNFILLTGKYELVEELVAEKPLKFAAPETGVHGCMNLAIEADVVKAFHHNVVRSHMRTRKMRELTTHTYIRKCEKHYKQIIFLNKPLLRCTCAASVQPYFQSLPYWVLSICDNINMANGKWGITMIMLFYFSIVAVRLLRFLFYAFSPILVSKTPSLTTP